SVLQTDQTTQNEVRNILDDNDGDIVLNAAKIVDTMYENMATKFQEKLDIISIKLNDQQQLMEKLQVRVEDQEWYSRTFCLQLMGFPEEKNEDTTSKLADFIFNTLGVEMSVEDTENSHRVGQYQNSKTRAFIARFFSRPFRSSILRSLYILRQVNSSIFVYEDIAKFTYELWKKERANLEGDKKKNIIVYNGRLFHRQLNDTFAIVK
ncbi:unnamed protein product, partial [Didymodactylos carnosus]